MEVSFAKDELPSDAGMDVVKWATSLSREGQKAAKTTKLKCKRPNYDSDLFRSNRQTDSSRKSFVYSQSVVSVPLCKSEEFFPSRKSLGLSVLIIYLRNGNDNEGERQVKKFTYDSEAGSKVKR